MIDAGDGTAVLAVRDAGFARLVGTAGTGSMVGIAGTELSGVADVVGAACDAGVAGWINVALGVGKPVFCKVMVALPSGWPMKLGITKAWGEGASAISRLILGAATSVALGGGFCASTWPAGMPETCTVAVEPSSRPR